MSIIIFDTETTGLTKQDIVDLDKQPKIIEFAGIKLDDKTLKEIDRIDFLVYPNQLVPKEATKIHGIKDSDLVGKGAFDTHYQKLSDFFFGTKYLIAHNIAFDLKMLELELRRFDKITQFPFPPVQICTVNKTLDLKGYRLKLSDLYNYLTGKEFTDAHRAMKDVEALTECVKILIKDETIKL